MLRNFISGYKTFHFMSFLLLFSTMQRKKCPIQRCSLLNNLQLNPAQKFPYTMVYAASLDLCSTMSKIL